MNKEELKNMIKTCVYSEDGITYMSDKQYNNYIGAIDKLRKENKQLKGNWNKLKQKTIDSFNKSQDVQFLDVLQDMQKLEKMEE